MMLLDTSVVIPLIGRKGRERLSTLVAALNGDDFVLSRVTEMEVLQGTRDLADWDRTSAFLAQQEILEIEPTAWRESAELYFDLRRQGVTVRSSFDCLIASTAMRRNLTLIHCDRDFELMAPLVGLKHLRLDFSGA